MEDPQALKLFQEVLQKTQANRIPWEPTADEANYIAPIGGNFTVSVLQFADTDQWGNDFANYNLILKDKTGRVLIRVGIDVDDVGREGLQALFEAARRRGLQIDQKLESFLGELGKL